MPPNNQPAPQGQMPQPTVDLGAALGQSQVPAPTPAPMPGMQPQPGYAPQQPMQPAMQSAPQPVQPMQPAPAAQAPTAAPQPAPAKDKKQAKKPPVNTTQKTLLFSEIRDGMVIMNDGSFRAVIACKSINFDLMSAREREGVEYSYQNFLNALYFPVQIFVRSQRVDIAPYLEKLDEMRRNQDNMLLNVLMEDYINFIDVLSQEANIMDKSFFVAVPYFPESDINQVVNQSKGFLSAFFPKDTSNQKIKIDQVTYNKAKDEIKNRVDAVMSGLFQIGIKCVQLNTKELGELYYNVYNPDTAVRQPLGDFERVTATYVQKGAGQPAVGTDGGRI